MRLPAGIVDPHIHQWDPFTTPRVVSREARLFRPLPRVPRVFRYVVPRGDREFIGDPHHILKPYLPDDYRRDTGAVDIASVVHIENSWKGVDGPAFVDETSWVASLPFGQSGAPELGAVVAHVDPRWPDVASVLDAHESVTPLLRGIRCAAANHPDPAVRDHVPEPALLRDSAFLKGFAAVAERDLSCELWIFSHQLPDAVVLAKEFPETTFVLDHYATPVGIFGPRGRSTGRSPEERSSILGRWRDDIADLAQLPNVVAKHSGLGMPVLGGDPARPYDESDIDLLAERAAPLVQHTQEVFGADRTMWASNYPMDKPVHTIPASILTIRTALGSDADLELLLKDVARRVYRIA